MQTNLIYLSLNINKKKTRLFMILRCDQGQKKENWFWHSTFSHWHSTFYLLSYIKLPIYPLFCYYLSTLKDIIIILNRKKTKTEVPMTKNKVKKKSLNIPPLAFNCELTPPPLNPFLITTNFFLFLFCL